MFFVLKPSLLIQASFKRCAIFNAAHLFLYLIFPVRHVIQKKLYFRSYSLFTSWLDNQPANYLLPSIDIFHFFELTPVF